MQYIFSQVPTAGLIAYYKFNGDVLDYSGYNNNGTSFGGITETPDRNGIPDSAYKFDGIDDYIVVPNDPSLNPTDQITVSAWYKPVSYIGSGNDPIIDKAYSSHVTPFYQYHLGVCGDSYWNVQSGFGFSISLDGHLYSTGTGSNFYQLNKWYHLVGIYDGFSVKLYVNNVLISSVPASGKIQDYGSDLYIARYKNFNDDYNTYYFLPGDIDEVRIYNRALTPLEISNLYTYSENKTDLSFSFTARGKCINDPIKFNYTGFPSYDSIRWDFGDKLPANNATELTPLHTYQTSGDYAVTLNMYYLNKKYTFSNTIKLNESPKVNLGNDTALCTGNTILLDAGNLGETYLWNTGSGQNQIIVNKPGVYSVEVTNICGISRDTIFINYNDSHPKISLGNDTTLCLGNAILLDAGNNGETYLWNTGSRQNQIITNKAGLYTVDVTYKCGNAKDSIYIKYDDFSNIYVPSDTSICKNSVLLFHVIGPENYKYQWKNGPEGKDYQINADNSSIVNLTVSNQFECHKSFSINLLVNDCIKEIDIPNVFTPNGDGKNDFWIIQNLDQYPNAIVEVYNRWGDLVYRSIGYKYPWDGYYNGKRLSPGCYFYVIILNSGHEAYNGPLMIY